MEPRKHRVNAQVRRDALLKATVEVAAENGIAGVTHRAVTEKAGLPLATVSYFFDSITDLAIEALRVFTEADVARQRALAEALRDQHSEPDEIAVAFAEAAAARMPESLALFEVFLHAARAPELRAAVAEAITAGRQVAAEAARAAGAEDPDAAALLALAHGYAFHTIAAPDTVDPGALRRAFRAQFLGGLLESGQVDLAVRLATQDR
ncbi:Transcriptional regulator, TetR family [Alloactinosynnema sp. L-07]|uniref:TetR/AcrR family transcriptional regulator n=1 Tax=Alloactinosynnema sp. L-07 TaxID=1653480 RepID=UPI00065F0A8D|nr:TetR family transcriptional regulator [Alloactinosynnema sp. L-07]CRK58047.1 Transcriptional regulator, TetR family [Alloactinosynnema sp. L-07]